MTEQDKAREVEQQETGQKTSAMKQYVTYWKDFMVDLFVGTTKRMIVSPVVFTFTFMAAVYVLYSFSIKPQETFFVLKVFEGLLVFLIYLIVGLVAGLLYGANTTLIKKIEELETGVDLIVDPLMKMVIERMPGGKKTISIEEFNTILDEQIKRFSKTSRAQFRLFSLFGMFSRFFLRNTLRILRYVLLNDFLEGLEEKGEPQLSAAVVEDYYREQLVSGVTEIYKTKLGVILYGIYGILVVFLVIPVLMVVVF